MFEKLVFLSLHMYLYSKAGSHYVNILSLDKITSQLCNFFRTMVTPMQTVHNSGFYNAWLMHFFDSYKMINDTHTIYKNQADWQDAVNFLSCGLNFNTWLELFRMVGTLSHGLNFIVRFELYHVV